MNLLVRAQLRANMSRSPARCPEAFPSEILPTPHSPCGRGSCSKGREPCGSVWDFGFCQWAFAAYAPSLRCVRYSTFPLTTPPTMKAYELDFLFLERGRGRGGWSPEVPITTNPAEPVLPYNSVGENGAGFPCFLFPNFGKAMTRQKFGLSRV